MDAATLKAQREALGLTKQGLADALGVTPQSIYLWETGQQPVRKVVDLAMQTLVREQLLKLGQLENDA
jgi:DNA-binding XRE family transcriptional regulator